MNESFWFGKKVIVTGHTGFKGSWLTHILNSFGAMVFGVSDTDMGPDSLYNKLGCKDEIANDQFGLSEFYEIVDLSELKDIVNIFDPEVIFHLAAQPLVISSYHDPVLTYKSNVIGTVNILEAARLGENLRSIISVTTDKVYKNIDQSYGYRESDPLGANDPYSTSKACADLVTQSYYTSFFQKKSIGVSSVRAGNVIGGGDWSAHRLIPDIVRSINSKSNLVLRNADATRPWQHVLEPLSGYLMLAEKMHAEPEKYSLPINFGPALSDSLSVKEVVAKFLEVYGTTLTCEFPEAVFHEANHLSLDSTTARAVLNWEPIWDTNESIKRTAEWYLNYSKGRVAKEITTSQINDYKTMALKIRSGENV